MKIDLNAMGYDELIAHGEEVMRMIRLRSYGEGYQQGKFDAEMDAEHTPESDDYPYGITDDDIQEIIKEVRRGRAQARRDEIVEQAKEDVEKLSNYGDGVRYETDDKWSFATCNVEFVVNRDKRTIVVLLTGFHSGFVYARGIAKAAPSDCFNVHIGKAIALRRALGLAVPDEYLNAPQPTEVRVGDVVSNPPEWTGAVIADDGWPPLNGRCVRLKDARKYGLEIIDDSREEVGGE